VIAGHALHERVVPRPLADREVPGRHAERLAEVALPPLAPEEHRVDVRLLATTGRVAERDRDRHAIARRHPIDLARMEEPPEDVDVIAALLARECAETRVEVVAHDDRVRPGIDERRRAQRTNVRLTDLIGEDLPVLVAARKGQRPDEIGMTPRERAPVQNGVHSGTAGRASGVDIEKNAHGSSECSASDRRDLRSLDGHRRRDLPLLG